MPRHVAKANLPSKICLTCGRPFTWRKRWERDWEQVRYCSDACRRHRPAGGGGGGGGSGPGAPPPGSG